MTCSTRLATDPFDPDREFALFRDSLDDEGALVSFVGIARPRNSAGGEVTGLFLDHHPRLTEASLRAIAEEAGRRFKASRVAIVHRCGMVAPGEAIVFVAAAALHRRAAFEAADYAMDRLKTEAFFWKREDAVDGARWVEPSNADRADLARWSD